MTLKEVEDLSQEDQRKVAIRLIAAAREGIKAFDQDEMETKATIIILDDMEADITNYFEGDDEVKENSDETI